MGTEGIERAGLTLPWSRDLLPGPQQQQCWRLTPGGVSWCPLRVRDSGVCSLRRFLPCSWDSAEATVLCYRLGHACLPLGLEPAHHSLIQRSHNPEQCSSSTAVLSHTSSTSVLDNTLPEPGWSPPMKVAGIPCLGVSFQCGSDALAMLACTRAGPQFVCYHWCHMYTSPQFCEAGPPLPATYRH